MATFVFGKSDPISLENYQRIKLGMTKKQVEDLLGGPPRCESNDSRRFVMHSQRVWEYSGKGSKPNMECWWGHRIAINVDFQDGVVREKTYSLIDESKGHL